MTSTTRAKRRHVPSKRELAHRLMPGLRPVLDAQQRRDLAMLHHSAVEDIRTGKGNWDTLYNLVGSFHTFRRLAELHDLTAPAIEASHTVQADLVARYKRTGLVIFAGREYEQCVDMALVMTELANMTDTARAMQAADWSETQIHGLVEAGYFGEVPQ